MISTKDDFEIELELIKKETHEKLNKLFDKFRNAKNWKVNFEYDWSINCNGSIDESHSGWYDALVEKRDALLGKDEVETDE